VPNQLDTFTTEALEAETRRLSRLARGLLYGEHDAEDAVQDAWLTVLRPGGEEPRKVRGWLAGAVRRMALTTRRADARRRRRERSAARCESLPSAAQTAGSIEVLRLLLEAIESLEEPYRRTIMLRFFDNRSPREIARAEGIPVNTVRSHISRGIEQLRRRLDAGREGRARDLLAVLAPLAGSPPWAAGPVATAGSSLVPLGGVFVMKQQVLLVALVVGLLLIVGGSWMVRSDGTIPDEDSGSRPPSLEEPVAKISRLDAGLTAGAGRSPLEPALAVERDWVVRGQVTLGYREAMPDANLIARLYAGASTAGELLEEQRLKTGPQGEFEWGLPRPDRLTTVVIVSDQAGFRGGSKRTSVPSGDSPPQDMLISLQPWDLVAIGRVLDSEGGPVAGAHVIGDQSETRTDHEGRYRLRVSSYRERAQAIVVAAGYRPERIIAIPAGPGEIQVQDVVLVAGTSLRGRVIDEAGAPVLGAEISIWPTKVKTTSDESGRFVLESFDPQKKDPQLRADGTAFCGQGRLVTSEEIEAGELEWVLKRGATMRGHVFGEDGSPVEHAACGRASFRRGSGWAGRPTGRGALVGRAGHRRCQPAHPLGVGLLQ